MNVAEKISDKCPECGNAILIKDGFRGEIICNACGLVIKQHLINSGVDWRAFNSEEQEKKVRVGAPANLMQYDKGLNTIIGRSNRDAKGNKISPKMIEEIRRLRTWNQRTMIYTPKEKNLAEAMTELDRISSQMNLSRYLKETAAHIYRKVMHLAKGRSIEAVVIASIYVACKINNVPNSIEDFIEFTSIDKKKIGRCYRLIFRELNLNINASSPISFIPKFAANLKLSENTKNQATKLLHLAKKYRLTAGKTPAGLAGGALYYASLQEGERRTQKEVSKAVGVTEATIRKRYKELARYLNYEIEKAKDNRSLRNCDEILQFRIVYYGPTKSGKTSNFKVLQQQFSTKKLTKGYSIETTNGSTLWHDSLYILFKFEIKNIKYGLIVQIVSAPAFKNFSATRKRILEGADGVIFVADSDPSKMEPNRQSFQELISIIGNHSVPIIIQLNKRDLKNAISIDEFNRSLNLADKFKYPDGPFALYPANALEGKNILKCFKTLILQVIFNFFKNKIA
jgi:transcription initiation factor TFIIB